VNHHGDIEEEDEEFEEVTAPPEGVVVRSDKASRLLGIRHQRSMVSLSLAFLLPVQKSYRPCLFLGSNYPRFFF
jgi:hypothetical protein